MRNIKGPNKQEKRNYSPIKLTIDEKLELFEQYLNEGYPAEAIVTDTVYQGYPIGRFLMGIRVDVKREDKKHKFSESNMEKLTELGLLDDRHESTLNEKVDRLVEFIKQYPQLWDYNTVDYKSSLELGRHVDKFLKEQNCSESREDLIKKLKLEEKDYEYITHRFYNGKLSDENLEKLREGKVGRRIGFPKEIEELAKGKPNEKAFKKFLYLCDKNYGGLGNFRKQYIEQIAKTGTYNPIPYIENFKSLYFDISAKNLKNSEYDKLFSKLSSKNEVFGVFDGQKLKELMERILDEKERAILKARYGLDNQERLILDKTGETVGVKRERVRQIEEVALKKLKRCNDVYYIKLGSEAKKRFLETYFEGQDIFKDENEQEMDKDLKDKLINIVEEEKVSYKSSIDDASILSLKLRGRALFGLLKLGVKNLEDLEYITKEDISNVENIGDVSLKEIIEKAHAKGIRFADDPKEDARSVLQSAIEATEESSRSEAINEQIKQINEIKEQQENKDISKKGEENEN